MRRERGPAASGPRQIFWELTTGCNLRCIYCRASGDELISTDDLSFAECCEVVHRIAEYSPLELVLTGGEPLWRRDVFGIAEYAVRYGLHVALATNGTLIDEAMAERIRDAGIRNVAVSLDGADAVMHDTFRGHQGAFDSAVRGIDLLRELGIRTEVNATVTRHNVHQLPEMVSLARRLGVRSLYLYLLQPVGCGLAIPGDQRITEEEAQELLKWTCEQAARTTVEVSAMCAPPFKRTAGQGLDAEQSRARRNPQSEADLDRCGAGCSSCFISHRGEVFACSHIPVSAGSLDKSGLRQLWEESETLRGFRDPSNMERKCGICDYRR